jgi:hypothetical protein
MFIAWTRFFFQVLYSDNRKDYKVSKEKSNE